MKKGRSDVREYGKGKGADVACVDWWMMRCIVHITKK